MTRPRRPLYSSVYAASEGADSAREDIYKDFLTGSESWSTANDASSSGETHEYRDAHDVGADKGAEAAQAGRALSPGLSELAPNRRERVGASLADGLFTGSGAGTGGLRGGERCRVNRIERL